MARKKQEISLQTELETQEEWEEMLSKEGLTVVDVYQEWAGPCKAMIGIFRRLKNEIGDDLLHFAVAKADTIDALERYRGKCEPCFLFFAGGSLVTVIRGCNSPHLSKAIADELAQEHKVIDGSAERKEIQDTALGEVDQGGQFGEESDEDEGADQKKDITVAILKPNLVRDGKVDEVIEKMKEAGIDILAQEEKTLTEEEAREFYAHASDKEYFEDLVKYMSSGPSHVLVLSKGDTGEGIIEEWRELLGPPSVEEAKSNAPDTLRAKYGGEENYVNSLHGSDGPDTAMKELAFFFPDFHVPSKPGSPAKRPKSGKRAKSASEEKKVQRTLALIRPDAMREKKDEILAKIQESGFTIAMQKTIQLSKEQAEAFYSEHQGQEYFEELTTRMSNGPLLALALAREDAVTSWREMLGPKEVDKAKEEAPESMRAQFAMDDVPINQLHGSDNPENAEKEINYFFPVQQTVAVIKPDAYQTKDEIMKKIQEAGFNVAARKETQMTKEIAEQFYKDQQDKEYFGELTEHMTSGPTLFMVLSREDAVDGWRSIIGPTDPAKAKEENPESLRAMFGTDVKANAVHGSSNPDHAKEHIQMLFGDIEFNPDGTVKGEEGAATEGETLQEQSEETPAAATDDNQPAEGGDSEQPAGDDQEGAVSRAEEHPQHEATDQPFSPSSSKHTSRPTNQTGSRPSSGDGRGAATEEETRPSSRPKSAGKEGCRPTSATKEDSRPSSAVKEGSRPTSANKEGSRPSSAVKGGSRPTSANKEETRSSPAVKEGSRPTSANKEGSRPSSAVKGGSRPTSANKEGSRPSSAVKEGSRPTSATKEGSRPSSAVKEGSKPTSATKEASRPPSAVKEGSRPTSATKENSRPSSAVKEGSTPTSANKESSRPSSAVKEGSRPTSAAKAASEAKDDQDKPSRPSSAASRQFKVDDDKDDAVLSKSGSKASSKHGSRTSLQSNQPEESIGTKSKQGSSSSLKSELNLEQKSSPQGSKSSFKQSSKTSSKANDSKTSIKQDSRASLKQDSKTSIKQNSKTSSKTSIKQDSKSDLNQGSKNSIKKSQSSLKDESKSSLSNNAPHKSEDHTGSRTSSKRPSVTGSVTSHKSSDEKSVKSHKSSDEKLVKSTSIEDKPPSKAGSRKSSVSLKSGSKRSISESGGVGGGKIMEHGKGPAGGGRIRVSCMSSTSQLLGQPG